jgi:hypothetical protein
MTNITFEETVRAGHIAAGIVALAAFWLPLLARKGGPLHRRAGWVYAAAMWIAAATAWGVCAFRLLDDNKANDAGALFLLFVGVLAANASFIGIRVLRTKKRTRPHTRLIDLAGPLFLLIGSVGLGGVGAVQRSVLFIAFAVLGAVLSISQLRFWLRPPVTKMDWWYEHMTNMLTACIGTATAFLVVNVPRLGLRDYALLFWLAPGVLGGVGIAVWRRYYRRRFEAHSRPRSPSPVGVPVGTRQAPDQL